VFHPTAGLEKAGQIDDALHMTCLDLEDLNSVNHCQISEMEKAGDTLDPNTNESCAEFSRHVRNVQAAIVHTYQMVAHNALRESNSSKAALLWKEMSELCDDALKRLKRLKEVYPHCGTPELYNLTLEYKNAAHRRYMDNLEDSECATMPLPTGLFPQMN
jgi:hypothetical protein